MKNLEANNGCQLWDAKVLGRKLSLSQRQIHRLNSSGKLPAPIRIGGAVRWSSEDISNWLTAGAPDRKTFEMMQEV